MADFAVAAREHAQGAELLDCGDEVLGEAGGGAGVKRDLGASVRVGEESLVGADDALALHEVLVVGVVEGVGRFHVEVHHHARVQVLSRARLPQVGCEGGVQRRVGLEVWLEIVDAVEELGAVDEPDGVASG